MERLAKPEKKGLNKVHLVIGGLIFLLLGIISRCVLQNDGLTDKISESAAMVVLIIAAILLMLETCAIPVFAFLLVDGFQKTENKGKLFITLLIVAVASEIPYNLATWGDWLNTATRNPAIGMAVSLAVLYFFQRYEEPSFANVLIKLFVAIAAWLWIVMLNVDHGVELLFVVITMWALRGRKGMQLLLGGAVASACAIFDVMYFAAAMGVLLVHFYKEKEDPEEEAQITLPFYAAYPVLLLFVSLLAKFVFEELLV